jgi:hypothetical protein
VFEAAHGNLSGEVIAAVDGHSFGDDMERVAVCDMESNENTEVYAQKQREC